MGFIQDAQTSVYPEPCDDPEPLSV
jgi:hypothetical protein